MSLLHNLKTMYSVQLKYIHCDNGEADAFEWLCKQEKMNVKFEYTASGTPQQSQWMKRKVYTLFS